MGSSRMSSSGSWSRAWATPRRWRIPLLYSPSGRSAAPVSPIFASRISARAAAAAGSMCESLP